MKKKPLSVAAAALAAVMLTTGCGQTASSVASSAAASSEIASSVAESTVSSAEETAYPLTLQIYDADGNAVDMPNESTLPCKRHVEPKLCWMTTGIMTGKVNVLTLHCVGWNVCYESLA